MLILVVCALVLVVGLTFILTMEKIMEDDDVLDEREF